MGQGAKEISAELDAALSSGSPTAETDKGGKPSTTEVVEKPLHEYPRFKELVDDRNKFKELFETSEDKNQKLLAILQEAEKDRALVADLRNLAASKSDDTRITGAIDVLDKALRGELEAAEQKVTETQATTKAAVDTGALTNQEAEKIVDRAKKELSTIREEILDHRAETLLDQARLVASKWLDALPQDYTDEDKNAIGKMWLHETDWHGIESDPTRMNDFLRSSLEGVLDSYGTPRGALVQKVQEEYSKDAKATAEPTAEEVIDRIRNIDWSARDDKGTPVLSDDQFNAQLANTLRLAKGINRR